MTYAHFVYAQLTRNRLRTTLTVMSIVVAYLLFGLLGSVQAAFSEVGRNADGAGRLVTGSRHSYLEPLPVSLLRHLASVDNVSLVTHATWFGGFYQDPRNQLATYAVADNYLDLYPEIEVDPWAKREFARTRTGVLVGDQLAERLGWKVGGKIPIKSAVFSNANGIPSWEFDVVGLLRARDSSYAGLYGNLILLHWDYLANSTPFVDGRVGWYVSRIDDVRRSDKTARQIDAISKNSPHETKTTTEEAAFAARIRQIADVDLIVRSVISAVFFTLLLLTTNTMAQAVRERRWEFAVLISIGFSPAKIFLLILAESMLLFIAGGAAGMCLASFTALAISQLSGGIMMLAVGLEAWTKGLSLAAILGIMVGVLPAIHGASRNVADSLARR